MGSFDVNMVCPLPGWWINNFGFSTGTQFAGKVCAEVGIELGTEFSTIVPERIAYWAPDVVQPAYVWTRKALACEWSAPHPKVQGPEPAPDPSLNLFEQMFGCSWKD